MSWEMVRLGDVGTIHTGSTPKTNDETLFNGEYPFVTPSDLIGSVPIEKTERTLSYKGVQVSTLLPVGSILVCCIGSLGKIGIAGTNLVTNQQINAVVFDSEKIDYRFGYYACSGLKKELQTIAPATTVPIINKSRFSELKIPLPPISEQKRIAAILDKADEIRRKREQAITKLEQLAQSIFVEMFGDPVINNKGWEKCKLGDLILNATDGPHVSPVYAESGIPFLSARHIKKGEIVWNDLKYLSVQDAKIQWKKCKPQLGDILYSKGGTTGYAAVVKTKIDFAIWVHIALLKPNLNKCNSVWLENMLNSRYCYRQSQELTHGIANKDLGLKRMVNISMYNPPIELQEEFAKRIKQIEKLKADNTKALANHNALFASLQQQAFSGNL